MLRMNRYIRNMEELKSKDNFRFLSEDQRVYPVDLTSNDYLGLNSDEVLYHGFLEEFMKNTYRFSASSSRLLLKNACQHLDLERLIAVSYGEKSCLLFNSGYLCNIGVISALASKNDLVIADKFVHASCIDGALLSPAKLMRYKHLDYEHLEQLLMRYRKDYEHVFIITESVFSMDGDVADLEKLVYLKNKYSSFLHVDEAHAIGVVGATGLGCVAAQGLVDQVDFIVGAFGKALASVGGFVICSELFKTVLINQARSFMFSTALPPVNVAWTHYVFERISDFKVQRENLKKISSQFSEFMGIVSQSQIVPYVVGSNHHAIQLATKLKSSGFNVLPIRTPTVPKNTARLRFSLTANHCLEELKPILKIIENYENEMAK